MTTIKKGVVEIGQFAASNGWMQGAEGEMFFDARTVDGTEFRIPAGNAIFMIALAAEQMRGKKQPSVKQLIDWLKPPERKKEIHPEIEGRQRVEMVLRFMFHNATRVVNNTFEEGWESTFFDDIFPTKMSLVVDALLPSMYADEKVHTPEENFDFFMKYTDELKEMNKLYRTAERMLDEGYR